MRDAKVGNAAIVKCVPFRGPLKGFLIVEDAILEPLDLFRELLVLHGGVGLVVGDGCEESVRNGVKELSINVHVGGEGGLGCPWGHCWGGWSCWTRDRKGNR